MKKIFFLSLLIGLILTSCQKSFDKQCYEEIRKESITNCPKKLSAEVILDSMNYSIKTKTINYYYSLSGKMNDPDMVDKNKGYYRAHVLKQLINSVDMKDSKDHKLNFCYSYRSSTTSDNLLKFILTENDYNIEKK